MDILPFNIFPSGSLTSSVIPTVWVGLFVVCFFNLRFGWLLSGLVVPGYLVPLILINPWSAAVIVMEGGITYFLVWLYSEYFSRWAPWGNLFGRDRFLMLVLSSILVRLLFDGWLLPEFGAWATRYFQISFDYRNHLHSFGLIIVALIANQFWKTRFVSGLLQLLVTLGATLIIVRYGLMELTNFGLGDLSYLYEDLASSILATPKAYIILVATAFLASRMNLYYGWDFNGILIPSLIALQWYQPVKILTTIVESGIILLLSVALLKTPWLQKKTIEGARKLLVFFNVGFVYKIALGYAALAWFPQVKTSDYFGFGYLLSTLVAVKIHDKAIFAQLTRATLQTSLTAVVIASVIGFVLTLLPITETFLNIQVPPKSAAVAIESSQRPLAEYLKQEQVELFEVKVNDSFKPPLSNELEMFSEALSYLLQYLQNKDAETLRQAAGYFDRVDFQLSLVQQRYLLIHEKMPEKGRGVYVLDLAADSKLVLELPAAVDEKGVIDAGIALFTALNARGFAIAGSSRSARADKSSDMLVNGNSFFQVFHRLVGLHDSLQLRVYSAELARQISGALHTDTLASLHGFEPALWVKRRIPESLDLVKLEKLLDRYRIHWNEPNFDNRQRQVSSYGFGELLLTAKALHNLAYRPLLLTTPVAFVEQELSIEGYLHNWILHGKEQIADKGSNLYVPPDLAQLLFFDEQVLVPLLDVTRAYHRGRGWTPALLDELRVIARDAAIMGYSIIRYRDRLTGQDYLVLAEQEGGRRYWGTYVLRMGAYKPYSVQVPRPLYEVNSFEFGVALFERLNAFALMIGATHPYANQDQSSDLVDPENKISLFSLFNQVLLREAGSREMLAISCRAYTYRPDYPYLNADAVLAFDQGLVERKQLAGLDKEVLDVLEADGMRVQLLDGSLQTQGYEVGSTTQSTYLNATRNKQFALLWLSPVTRAMYRQQDENFWQIAQFNAIGIETVEDVLSEYLKQRWRPAKHAHLPESIRALAEQYLEDADVVRLQQLYKASSQQGYALIRLLDLNSKQAFLIFRASDEALPAVINLAPRNASELYWNGDSNISEAVAKFIEQRAAWLLLGGE